MRILLTGASGFLGQALTDALLADGHEVHAVVRQPSRLAPRPGLCPALLDVNHALQSQDWLPLVTGMDVVINAVGIFRQGPGQRFELVHKRAPQALFAACDLLGVGLVLQVSALGAGEAPSTAFLQTKRAADDFLLQLPLRAVVLRPSLVYGEQGASARLFNGLASLPLWFLPGRRGGPMLQPVHLQDLVDAVRALLRQAGDAQAQPPWVLACVGPEPLSFKDYLLTLRRGLGLWRTPWMLPLPVWLMRAAARVAGWLRSPLIDADAMDMLLRGNQADSRPLAELLGRAPRPAAAFIAPERRHDLRRQAQLGWLLPLARWSLAAVWIWTGIVSAGLYPREQSLELLARVGATGLWAVLLLYGAAALDVLLGLATLWLAPRWRPALWQLQAALVLAYTALISWRLPEYWLHPYGPVLKNLPILALLLLLHQLEDPAAPPRKKPWTTSG
jgi:uncharacterized protein YbjT (DUF2867 family)